MAHPTDEQFEYRLTINVPELLRIVELMEGSENAIDIELCARLIPLYKKISTGVTKHFRVRAPRRTLINMLGEAPNKHDEIAMLTPISLIADDIFPRLVAQSGNTNRETVKQSKQDQEELVAFKAWKQLQGTDQEHFLGDETNKLARLYLYKTFQYIDGEEGDVEMYCEANDIPFDDRWSTYREEE